MTRHKKPRPTAASAMIATIAVVAFLFAACDRGTVGIFASIEREEKTVQSNLPKDQTAKGFAETSDAYFVAIGTRVWTRLINVPEGESEPWNPITPPSGASVAVGVAASGDNVVAAYVGEDGSTIEVRLSSNLTSVLGSENLAGQVVSLFTAGDEVFVVENRPGDGHFLHRLDLTTPDSPTTEELVLPGQRPQVLDTAYHDNTYRFVTSNTVFTTDLIAAPTVFATVPGSVTNIGGVAVTDDGTVVVSSNSAGKFVYSADGGTTWLVSGDADATGFPSVAVIDGTVYLGARRGVYTLPVTGLDGTPAVVTGQGYESSALRNAEVLGFFEASEGDIFILTSKGLWRRNVVGDSVSWIWE